MTHFKIPVYILVLDGAGSVLAILGLLGLLEADVGLPVLTRIWPMLLALGLALMAPLIAWVIRLARSRS